MNLNNKLDYSVLMSVYKNDKAEYIKSAIESMINQTVTPKQYVVVVDGPVGAEIGDTITKYEKEHPDLFTIIRLKENRGLGNALNIGMKECRYELIARMDADDISLPQRCERQLEKFESNPQLSILGTQIKEFVGEPSNIVSQRKVPISFKEIQNFAKRRSPFNHPTVMYKKSVIIRLGGYPSLCRKEDLALFVLAVSNGVYSENLKESLLLYRTSNGNQKRRRTWINCKEYIQVMYKYYKRRYIGLADLLYVILGQLSLFILPTSLTNKLSKRYLRSDV